MGEYDLLSALNACDRYATLHKQLCEILSSMNWLLTIERRKSSNRNISNSFIAADPENEEFSENHYFQSTIRIKPAYHEDGRISWSVITLPNANKNDIICLINGVSSPQLRKIATVTVPEAVNCVVDIMNTLNDIH